MMTVKDLITSLKTFHPDDHVVLAKDLEGNGFGHLFLVSEDMYNDNEITIRKLTPELAEQGYTPADVGTPEEGYTPCVTLWPEN